MPEIKSFGFPIDRNKKGEDERCPKYIFFLGKKSGKEVLGYEDNHILVFKEKSRVTRFLEKLKIPPGDFEVYYQRTTSLRNLFPDLEYIFLVIDYDHSADHIKVFEMEIQGHKN